MSIFLTRHAILKILDLLSKFQIPSFNNLGMFSALSTEWPSTSPQFVLWSKAIHGSSCCLVLLTLTWWKMPGPVDPFTTGTCSTTSSLIGMLATGTRWASFFYSILLAISGFGTASPNPTSDTNNNWNKNKNRNRNRVRELEIGIEIEIGIGIEIELEIHINRYRYKNNNRHRNM